MVQMKDIVKDHTYRRESRFQQSAPIFWQMYISVNVIP